MSEGLFVIPDGRRDGFQASIRGHMLGLADPSSGRALAPTPDDLFVVSIASELAWSARSLLRDSGMPDSVSVSATWRRQEQPGPTDIEMTVAVSKRAETTSAALRATLADRLAARLLAGSVVNLSFEGGKS
jgi:uncharacterized OsmC-like protein